MQKTHRTSRLLVTSAMSAVAAVALASCGNDGSDYRGMDENESGTEAAIEQGTDQDGNDTALATAGLEDAGGESLGQVEFSEADQGIEVSIEAENMEAGFYGFHIHEIGECEPDSEAPDDPEDTGDFMSAGGHLAESDDVDHPDHAGDLPVLLVNEDGTGQMSVMTDRLDEDQLLDDDGAAVMLHSDPDNFAQVPERYLDGESTPDDDTLSAGDAGDRLGCGVIEE